MIEITLKEKMVRQRILIRSKYISYILTLIITPFLATELQAQTTEKPANPNLEELREKAATVIALGDSVKIRSRITDIWNLVDRLDQLDKTNETLKYLEFGLQHEPWALKYQLLYASELSHF